MNPYIFKRKDEPIAIINLTEDGSIVDYKLNSKNEELAPLHTEGSTNWLKEWWKRRAVPIEQGHIKTMLEKKGLLSPEDFLVKNLGLSLTDYYWISPVDSGLKWKDVNLFVNEFHDDIIKVCGMYGLDESVLRPFLEYQIMTDFIISGRDRHLANISVLRDANTLEFVKPAPIYDSGKSLFVNDSVPANNKDMLKIATESFQNTELKLLGLVKDRSLVDVDKLPSAEFIRELYELDSNISENRIEEIMRGYEMKIDLFSRWQKGEDLKKIVVNFKSKPSNKNMKDIFVE